MNKFDLEKTLAKDPLWQAQVAALATISLQFLLPDNFLGGSKYTLIFFEIVLLLSLLFTSPRIPIFRSILRRINAVTLIGLVSFANLVTLERLAHFLLLGGRISNGHQLILAAINIYITNIIIFALWYWEIDGGGPGRRLQSSVEERDFLFPHMALPEFVAKWRPTFLDYLYVSVTNATAFSPTDTMPLSRRAKILMGVQATASLITLALVAARAVNILG